MNRKQHVNPLGHPAHVGTWQITVDQVLDGTRSAEMTAAANEANSPAPAGLSYLLVRMEAINHSASPRTIAWSDFHATGSDGILRPSPSVVISGDPFQGIVESGGVLAGWIVALVNDPQVATLWYDTANVGKRWTDGVFALAQGAVIPSFRPTSTTTDIVVGSSLASPASFGDVVSVGDWEVIADHTLEGQAIYDISDYRLQALGNATRTPDGKSDIPNWFGVYIKVRNRSEWPSFFSATALAIADERGERWDDILTLTPPDPDVSQYYVPGARGEGWVVFQRRQYDAQTYSDASILVLQPSPLVDSPRYIRVGSGSSSSNQPIQTPTLDTSYRVGDEVVTNDSNVNLRSQPSTKAGIVSTLAQGAKLTITGEPKYADGHWWYPVRDTQSGKEGYVAAEFVQ